MPDTHNPRVPRTARRGADLLPVTRVSLPRPDRPAPPLAPPRVAPTHSFVRRRWPLALRVLMGLTLVLLCIAAVLGALLLAGQTALVAWLVVGAVLTVVFGTPLLVVLGLLALFVHAMSQMGRARRSPQPPRATGAPLAQTIVVGTVVDDES